MFSKFAAGCLCNRPGKGCQTAACGGDSGRWRAFSTRPWHPAGCLIPKTFTNNKATAAQSLGELFFCPLSITQICYASWPWRYVMSQNGGVVSKSALDTDSRHRLSINNVDFEQPLAKKMPAQATTWVKNANRNRNRLQTPPHARASLVYLTVSAAFCPCAMFYALNQTKTQPQHCPSGCQPARATTNPKKAASNTKTQGMVVGSSFVPIRTPPNQNTLLEMCLRLPFKATGAVITGTFLSY